MEAYVYNYKKRSLLLSAVLLAPLSLVHAAEPTPAEARAIARDAYVYVFPLVDHYRIQHAFFVDREGDQYKSAWKQVH